MSRDDEQRDHFRIRYPWGTNPTLRAAGVDHPVTELSEGGLRVHGVPEGVAAGSLFAGSLECCCGERHEVTAIVGRREGEECVLVELTGVSFAAVMREQQHLVQHHPTFRIQRDG
ncbi:MAG: hypothetical protein ACON4Z_08580 [Planctomycetota bacterium]